LNRTGKKKAGGESRSPWAIISKIVRLTLGNCKDDFPFILSGFYGFIRTGAYLSLARPGRDFENWT